MEVLPLIIEAISAGIGGTELGMNLAGVGKPSSGAGEAAKQAQQAQQAQALADQQAKQKAILASLPNAQEQGGGALSAPSLTDLASVIAGFPGESSTAAGKGALTQFLGGPTSGAGTGDTMVGATYGLSGSQG